MSNVIINVLDLSEQPIAVVSSDVIDSVSNKTYRIHSIVHKALEKITDKEIDDISINDVEILQNTDCTFDGRHIKIKWSHKNSQTPNMRTSIWHEAKTIPFRVNISHI